MEAGTCSLGKSSSTIRLVTALPHEKCPELTIDGAAFGPLFRDAKLATRGAEILGKKLMSRPISETIHGRSNPHALHSELTQPIQTGRIDGVRVQYA
jgi:hypothetical protein